MSVVRVIDATATTDRSDHARDARMLASQVSRVLAILPSFQDATVTACPDWFDAPAVQVSRRDRDGGYVVAGALVYDQDGGYRVHLGPYDYDVRFLSEYHLPSGDGWPAVAAFCTLLAAAPDPH